MDSITDLMDMSFSKLLEIVEDMEVLHASVHGVAKSQTQSSHGLTIVISSHIIKVKVKVTQLCPTLWDSMDYAVHGILRAEYWSV